MDYSIGDRVEVLLERKLYTAEVRAVYNSGKVDVVYDADKSVGYLLKPCSMEGCTTNAKARGLCSKHGAYGKCVTMGCVTNARKKGGHCSKHSKKVACAAPNCSTPLVDGKGVCAKHGAHGICTAWGCKTNAASGKKGHCTHHSKDKPTCSASDCSNGVAARGLCYAHGAQGFCSTAGCDTGARKDGLCTKHGAKKICTFNDCTTAANARGLCVRHGGGGTKVCDIEGCKTRAHARLKEAVHLVGAACDPTFIFAAAMFDAEAFASRGGGAARHGARLLLLPTAVFEAMLEPSCCRGGASIYLAPPIRTMPTATATCLGTSLAALDIAHFSASTAMSATQSSCVSSSRAIVKRAEAFGTMLRTQAIFPSACIAPSSRAKSPCPVHKAKSPCNNSIAAV
eukprot:gene32723-biopygen30523